MLVVPALPGLWTLEHTALSYLVGRTFVALLSCHEHILSQSVVGAEQCGSGLQHHSLVRATV